MPLEASERAELTSWLQAALAEQGGGQADVRAAVSAALACLEDGLPQQRTKEAVARALGRPADALVQQLYAKLGQAKARAIALRLGASRGLPTAAASATAASAAAGATASADDAQRASASLSSAVARAQAVAAALKRKAEQESGQVSLGVPSKRSRPAGAVGRSPAPTALRLDEAGRLVDEHGNLVGVQRFTPELKANIRAEKWRAFQLDEGVPEDLSSKSFYDPDVAVTGPRSHERRAFRFVEQGTYMQQAQNMRAQVQLSRLKQEVEKASKQKTLSAAARMALLTPASDDRLDEEHVPDVEPWDAKVLPVGGSYADVAEALGEVDLDEDFFALSNLDISLDASARPAAMEGVKHEESGVGTSPPDMDDVDTGRSEADGRPPPPAPAGLRGISHLVEHPIETPPPKEPTLLMQPMLTKKERVKIRKQRRMEKRKEQQELVQFGLVEPEAPKVKISNLMRVLASEAVQDPTKVEAEVRAQIAARLKKHEDENAARKLTPEERREKTLRKIEGDNAGDVHVAVFRISDLSMPQHKYKVDVNAQQLHLTGVCVISGDTSIVVVEGGPKGIKKYKKLMTERIRWNEDHDSAPAAGGANANASSHRTCDVVWEGIVPKRAFQQWSLKVEPTEAQARATFARAGASHYWDMALYEQLVADEED